MKDWLKAGATCPTMDLLKMGSIEWSTEIVFVKGQQCTACRYRYVEQTSQIHDWLNSVGKIFLNETVSYIFRTVERRIDGIRLEQLQECAIVASPEAVELLHYRCV